MDELLAALGYKVRFSDMTDVAQKLEQLEMVLGTAQEDGISHLASDTVHYDPADLYGWVQTMLTELNNYPDSLDPSALLNSQQIDDPILSSAEPAIVSGVFNDDSEYDLTSNITNSKCQSKLKAISTPFFVNRFLEFSIIQITSNISSLCSLISTYGNILSI